MHFHFICLARANVSIMKSPFSSINFFPPTVICSMLLLHDNLQRFSMQYMLSQASMNWMASFLSPVIILIVKFGKDKKRFVCKFDVLFSLAQLHCQCCNNIATTCKTGKWMQNLCLRDKVRLHYPLVGGVLGPRVIMEVTSDFSRYSTGKNIQDLLKLMVLPWGSHFGVSTHIIFGDFIVWVAKEFS